MVTKLRFVIIGEVLFDVFPDGTKKLGGAPLNVAWHLRGLGAKPLLISRLGEDSLGEEALIYLKEWGLDTSLISRDPKNPTGKVEVKIEGNEPRFDILYPAAYDNINLELEKLNSKLGNSIAALIYSGTLIARAPSSKKTLYRLIDRKKELSKYGYFLDINLRAPWYDIEEVRELVKLADYVKLNLRELAELMGFREQIPEREVARAAEELRWKNELSAVFVTLGRAGALVVHEGGFHLEPAPQVIHFVDSVGAGDAFSAAAMLGIALRWDIELTLKRAVDIAARLCEHKGAIVRDRGFYEELRKAWGLK